MSDYSYQNATAVLETAIRLKETLANHYRSSFNFRETDQETNKQIFDELSIFDLWPKHLTKSHLSQIINFCKLAIKTGYTGYVCFKVGAKGCANGMWAHQVESTTGYSPNTDSIYRSFTPAYTSYAFVSDHNVIDFNTSKELIEYLKTK